MKPLYLLPLVLFFAKCATTQPGIAAVEFHTSPCFGACPVFTLNIAADGTATYNAEKHNKQTGNFKTTIQKEKLDSLQKLIQQAGVFTLNDNYRAPITDQPTYTLTITQKNGQSKSIKDYGPSGPDKLRKIYEFLFRLRDNQAWQ
jgi:hypothetical protein